MIVLAMDPSLVNTAFVVFDTDKGVHKILHSEVFSTKKNDAPWMTASEKDQVRIDSILDTLIKIVNQYQPILIITEQALSGAQ